MSTELVHTDPSNSAPVTADLLSRRVEMISVAPTIAIAVRAAALKDAGQDVIGLSVGEPDFDTPEHVIAAADKAARTGYTRYTAPDGGPMLKDAVREKFAEAGLHYGRDEIHVASGAKQVIHNAFAATLDPGDEVVTFAPGWVSYADIVTFCGGIPVVLQTFQSEGFLPSPEALQQVMGPRTKWVLLNSPNNPTGAVYPRTLLRRIAEVVAAHPRAMVMSDEIYEHLVFDGAAHVGFLDAAPEMRGRALVVNGVSKTYAMTGWRIGYAGGPHWLIQAMAKVQSQTAGSSCSVAQAAATAALRGDQGLVPKWRAIMQRRRDLALAELAATDRLSTFSPDGAFYIFADVGRCLGMVTPAGKHLANDEDFADYLLTEAKVATVPGSAFGSSPFVRLSFALDEERVAEACRRIAQACNQLRNQ